MIEFASNHEMDISSQTYEVKVINQSGIEEAAEDNGGVMRDSLTEFWDTFYMQLCIGNEYKLPVLRHDMTAPLWKSVAKIIRLGWEKENIFPVKLAPPFIEQCLFGEGDCPQFRRFSMPKVLKSEGSQFRRISSPKINTIIICVHLNQLSLLCDTSPYRLQVCIENIRRCSQIHIILNI